MLRDALRSAATRISNEQVERLSTLCDEMERITRDGVVQLNPQLHGSAAEVAGNFYLGWVRNIVVVVGLVLRGLQNYTLGDLQRSNNHRRDLLVAFAATIPTGPRPSCSLTCTL